MNNKQESQEHIRKIIKLFDKFSVSLMNLISKLVKQKIVSIDAILAMLPKKMRDKVGQDFSQVKKQEKSKKIIR